MADTSAIIGAEWNYEPCVARHVTATIPEWIHGDPKAAWWRHLEGTTMDAILVTYTRRGYKFLIANHDGSGLEKVLNGGGPDRSSKHLPLRSLGADRG